MPQQSDVREVLECEKEKSLSMAARFQTERDEENATAYRQLPKYRLGGRIIHIKMKNEMRTTTKSPTNKEIGSTVLRNTIALRLEHRPRTRHRHRL